MTNQAKQTIPAGYKQTEVGVIPTDWDVKRLGDIAPLQRGFDLPNSQLKEGNFPVVYSNGILNYHQKAMAKQPGVVTGRSGTIGRVHYITSDYWPHNTTLWVTDFKGNDEKFIYFLYFQLKFERFSTGSGVPTLNRNNVHNYKVAFPKDKSEQITIAATLSDIDALIEGLEKLIAKKRAIKQGTMQELLTGKRRLAGFSGMWEVKKLGDISAIKTGKKNNEDKVKNGQYPFFVRSQTVERINAYSFNGEAILVPGEGGIGSIFHYVNGKFDYHQRVYKISDFHENMCGKFIYYCMIQTFYKHAMRNSVKATVDSLRLPTFVEFEFLAPSFEEQTVITQVLSDVDAEIEELERKLNKYKMIKQGMIQVLLSGKIRLI